MKIFFLGGTFDPPHLGHLNIAKTCLKHCQKFLFIPSKQNPYKNKPYFSSSDRLNMLRIMISDIKNIEIDLFEFESKNKINRSIDIINHLISKYNNASIYMVVGEDLLFELEAWKDWDDIQEKVDIVYIGRPGYSYVSEGKDKNFLMIDDLKTDISSSSIREKIKSNKSHKIDDINHMLDSNVFNYILKNRNKNI